MCVCASLRTSLRNAIFLTFEIPHKHHHFNLKDINRDTENEYFECRINGRPEKTFDTLTKNTKKIQGPILSRNETLLNASRVNSMHERSFRGYANWRMLYVHQLSHSSKRIQARICLFRNVYAIEWEQQKTQSCTRFTEPKLHRLCVLQR